MTAKKPKPIAVFLEPLVSSFRAFGLRDNRFPPGATGWSWRCSFWPSPALRHSLRQIRPGWLVVAPGACCLLFSRLWHVTRWLLQQHYARAERLARLLRWFHPTESWWNQPKLFQALELGRQGNITEATRILENCKAENTPVGTLP